MARITQMAEDFLVFIEPMTDFIAEAMIDLIAFESDEILERMVFESASVL